jgi:hypothetical protein
VLERAAAWEGVSRRAFWVAAVCCGGWKMGARLESKTRWAGVLDVPARCSRLCWTTLMGDYLLTTDSPSP